MSNKPKIAILTIKNSYNFGGVFTCVRKVYKFCERYFEPTVFCLNFDKEISTSLKSLKFSSDLRKTKYFGMNYVEIGARWAFWEPGHYVYSLPDWQKALKDYKYFFMKSGSCIAAYPLVKLNKKFAMWVGTSYEDDKAERVKNLSGLRYLIDRLAANKMRKIEKEILQKAGFIWAISKNTKKRIEQILQKKRENLIVCNYPVEHKKVNFPEIKKEKNIIAVGRFSDPRKNINMLISAFQRMHKVLPELKLYVVGQKPSEEISSKFYNLSCFKNIIFTGPVDSEQLDKYYKNSCLMLITSYQEGLGIIGLEALAWGLPVIATDCGGTKDYIINDRNGYLVKIDDDKYMAQKALKILSSQNIYNQMSKFAYDFVNQNFSENKINSIFKVGLTRVYPELNDLFKLYDASFVFPFQKMEKDIINIL